MIMNDTLLYLIVAIATEIITPSCEKWLLRQERLQVKMVKIVTNITHLCCVLE